MIAGHVLTHPFPKTLNRVEIGTIARQGHDGEAQLRSLRLDNLGRVTRCTVPDDHGRNGRWFQPGSQMAQKLDCVVAIAATFVPDETLTIGEVIGAIPVDPVLQTRAVTQSPGWLALLCPGIAQIHVLMKMRLIDVDQPRSALAHLRIELLEGGHEGGTLGGIRTLEHFLALFPGQIVRVQQLAQRASPHFTGEDLLDPAPQLLQRPVMARQVMLDRRTLFHRGDDLLDLFGRKRGVRPPVRS